MAAAKALLSAVATAKAKTNTTLLKKSTVTEHARSSTGDVSCLPLTGLQGSDSKDDSLIGNNDLEKIVSLLVWMAQDFQSDFPTEDIHCAALAVVTTQFIDISSLHTATVAKLSKLIDIIMLDKDGTLKNANLTLAFMRRVAKVREELQPTSSDNATERVELGRKEVSLCYRQFARILLTNDLLPHQRRDIKYRLRNKFKGDTHLSTFQRSFTDNQLRKYLGDKKVAYLIWQQGIPSVAERPVVLRRRMNSKVLDIGMLQSSLDECLQWYTCLANHIVVHQSQEGYDAQLSASSKDKRERQRQQTRREAQQKARDDLQLGKALAKQRDDKKRSYHDMDNAEQKILEDYDTGKLEKVKQGLTVKRMKPFRCKLNFND